ncbi:MAG: hypothetical protein ACKO1U_00280 [Bacteroidota bacterium]
MKSITTLLSFMVLATGLTAQNLQNVSLLPPNPTSVDTVKVVAELMFTSGGCDLVSSYSAVTGSQIDVEVKHCAGLLAVICYATDTISLGILQPGAYQLNFSALTGTYDFNGNCTNFQSGGQQSLQFQVTGTSGSTQTTKIPLSLRFDPDNHQLILQGTDSRYRLRITDLTGRTIFNEWVSTGLITMDRTLGQGIYIYTLQDQRGDQHSGRVVVR